MAEQLSEEDDGREESHEDESSYLPRSIFVPRDDPREEVRETVYSILSDQFMAFLSVLLIPIILVPFVTTVSGSLSDFFNICDATIVLFFVIEYVSKIYLAESRWEYFTSPWHILDLIIVVFSVAQYLPLLGLKITGSPALLLRLLRLPRALVVTGRVAGSRIVPPEHEVALERKKPVSTIQVVEAGGQPHTMTWDELSTHLSTTEQEWIDITEVSEDDIHRLSALLSIPPRHFKSSVVDEIFPHIDYFQQTSFIFLKSGRIEYPERADSYMRISQAGLVVICRGEKLITLSPHRLGLISKVAASNPTPQEDTAFVVSCLYGILDSTLKVYKSIFSEIELEVIRIGNTPRSRLPKDFLERMYELKKEVSRLVSNVVHFKTLLNILISRRVTLEGFDDNAKDSFNILLDEANFQSDLADDLTDNIQSLIDLYINQTSFDTNRIIKILAVITAVSVIPAAVGGVLGMNLLDMPYGAYLWEVALMISISMTFAIYVFIKLGWLET